MHMHDDVKDLVRPTRFSRSDHSHPVGIRSVISFQRISEHIEFLGMNVYMHILYR